MPTTNPITPFIARQGALVLDGGLATELERRGADLADALWSARLLADDPALIRQVHLDYYWAGADCCTSASYQATVPGFMARGLSAEAARALIRRAVALTIEARDAFWAAGP
ncbi:MAG: homocysteine S-methyltransferase family protein, partial [Candidatus Promineofilum sp.]|nr:homocysteine S-methyltransferase family protein [Promineifilum sp.]